MGIALVNKNSIYNGIATPRERTSEHRGRVNLPSGTVVVSADNHWSFVDDIFYERFPAHLRDRAPRAVNDDGAFIFHVDGKSLFTRTVSNILRTHDSVPGNHRMEQRIKDMDAEGVRKEIVFGNAIGAFYAYPDLEVREWVFRIYNQYMSELQQQAPGRFYGVGLINYWEPERTAESIAELKKLGLKTFLIPMNPYGAERKSLSYGDESMNPMWQAIEDSGMPLCFHVGEFALDGPGGVGLGLFQTFGPFRKNFGELVFAGIFDRHPNLRVVFVEADLNWIPGALQNAEVLYEVYNKIFEPQLKHRPSYYWHNNCYATFMSDPIGLKMLDIIGADRVMWTQDYPHPESLYGCNWSAIQELMDHVPSEDDVRKILGGTALELFNL
ncbi:amidohydrolase family protein [Flavisphingomonas formosensis]|uniref:amidohydrolase family protein n=1 Tax=Flavisphingomonas formosensis TaxID=861534 RepID=UPI0012F95745|nr:amidohydrolase family protein [Sphingomonas formosensis]